MKKILLACLLLVLIGVGALFITKSTHAPSTTSQPSCKALTVVSPKENTSVGSSFTLQTVVDNRNSQCHWNVFEAQAGTVEVKDTTGNVVGAGTLVTGQEWITNNPVTYTATVILTPTTQIGQLTVSIHEENPRGKIGQTVSFSLLY